MIYDKEDITCYARMRDKMSETLYMDGTFDLRIILTPENIERLLACAKEAGLA